MCVLMAADPPFSNLCLSGGRNHAVGCAVCW